MVGGGGCWGEGACPPDGLMAGPVWAAGGRGSGTGWESPGDRAELGEGEGEESLWDTWWAGRREGEKIGTWEWAGGALRLWEERVDVAEVVMVGVEMREGGGGRGPRDREGDEGCVDCGRWDGIRGRGEKGC